jgi:hypothetical protein
MKFTEGTGTPRGAVGLLFPLNALDYLADPILTGVRCFQLSPGPLVFRFEAPIFALLLQTLSNVLIFFTV